MKLYPYPLNQEIETTNEHSGGRARSGIIEEVDPGFVYSFRVLFLESRPDLAMAPRPHVKPSAVWYNRRKVAHHTQLMWWPLQKLGQDVELCHFSEAEDTGVNHLKRVSFIMATAFLGMAQIFWRPG